MQKIIYPPEASWPALCKRPQTARRVLDQLVSEVFDAVATEGDEAVLRYIRQFDKVACPQLAVPRKKLQEAAQELSDELKAAIQLAAANIERFHEAQKDKPDIIETMPGVYCWRESRAIENVGLYIPGGTAPLFSTVLMLAIPARLAGCREILLCTPTDAYGNIHPAILYAASLSGVTQVYGIGGIQAIAAMALGTGSVPAVDKLFGPGNQYVMAAKQRALSCGVAIDMPAGPSEVLVIADQSAVPDFVAADLLSQAEHGPDSQVILLSDKEQVLDEILKALREQVPALPRAEIVTAALRNSKAILLPSPDHCLGFSNLYAPEHLILALDSARAATSRIVNAGSVFLGHYSCESAGDYASGTNHTLPTNGYARSYSGVSLDSFLKKITFQELTPQGLRNIGPAIEQMAEAEALFAHKNAVTIRLKTLQ